MSLSNPILTKLTTLARRVMGRLGLKRLGPASRLAMACGLGIALLGFVSSLAGPGYLSSLVVGLLLPTPIAITVALHVGRSSYQPEQAYVRGVGLGLAAGAATAVALLLQGLRVGLCDPLSDWPLFALGPL